jgi:hypothetical protein
MVETLEKTIPKPITSFQKDEIIDKLALEIPQRKIASQHNVSQNRISNINKEQKVEVKKRKLALQALAPNILEEFKYDCLTSTELSKHLYRPKEFPNKTALQNNQEITYHKNSLSKQKIKILENIGIFESQALINYNLSQFNDNRTQTTVISDNVLNMFSNHAESLVDSEVIDVIEDTTKDEDSDNVDNS